MSTLRTIQQELKSPKSEYNEFGGYSYRTKEKILEALKPLLAKTKSELTFQDELVLLGDWVFVKSAAVLNDGKMTYTAYGYARHASDLPKMQPGQVTGATSSYARKDALDALFLLNSSTDIDTMKPPVDVKAGTALRQQPIASGKGLVWLNAGTKAYTAVLEDLKSKKTTLDEVKKTYRLSKPTEVKLINDIK